MNFTHSKYKEDGSFLDNGMVYKRHNEKENKKEDILIIENDKIYIKKDGTYHNWKSFKKINKLIANTHYKIIKRISINCWYLFNQGIVSPFSDNDYIQDNNIARYIIQKCFYNQ
jgi:hypothetical protein